MAGLAEKSDVEAKNCYLDNIKFAAQKLAEVIKCRVIER